MRSVCVVVFQLVMAIILFIDFMNAIFVPFTFKSGLVNYGRF
jgi:hypothetical protein